ncbi:glycosyltransferase family 39 protein [Spirilliplanes yamanashiensis]|nr:glycosyltransferase family 39 protein [Spirilliplanes yamanashiensis]MDP9817869.1 hypothetical protein [Spirilliplanes yamanashiensis]
MAEPAAPAAPAPEPTPPAAPATKAPATRATPAATLRQWGRRAARATVHAAPALVGYAALRAVGLVALWWAADAQGRDFWGMLARWDGRWYRQIVEAGYHQAIPVGVDGVLQPTNLAFFPLYPWLVGAVDPAVPGGVAVAQIVVSWVASLAAAWGLFAVGDAVGGRRAGVALALVFAVVPHAVVESMAYTETVFTAFAAWALWAVLRRHWVLAGVLCSLGGLTRPTGGALVVAVGLAALVAVCRRPRDWRAWLGGALAPLGFLGFAGWVGVRLGRWDGYLHVQGDAWGMAFDGGAYTLARLGQVLTQPADLQLVVVSIVLLAGLALLALLPGRAMPWPLVVYAAVVLVLAVGGDGFYHAKARLLLPAFPLLLPVALGLAKARLRTVVVTLGVLALFSAWYGVYLLTIWNRSP